MLTYLVYTLLAYTLGVFTYTCRKMTNTLKEPSPASFLFIFRSLNISKILQQIHVKNYPI